MSITATKITVEKILRGLSPNSKGLKVVSNDINPIVDDLTSIDARATVLEAGTFSLATLTVTSGSQTGSDTPTINASSGTIITAVTATAGLAVKTVTLTNSKITAASKVFVSIGDYGGTGVPILHQVTPAAGSVVIKIYNAHASVALSAAFDIDFLVIN